VVAPHAPRPQDPQSADAAEIRRLVEAFIKDYFEWNQAACAGDSVEEAKASYDALVARYCGPGFPHQPISYGSPPMHEPGLEKVEAIEIGDGTALVKTKNTRGDATYTFVSNFEYHLDRVGGRWQLRGVFYVDDEGNYECL
jgi:hypothetical protein